MIFHRKKKTNFYFRVVGHLTDRDVVVVFLSSRPYDPWMCDTDWVLRRSHLQSLLSACRALAIKVEVWVFYEFIVLSRVKPAWGVGIGKVRIDKFNVVSEL